LLEKDSNAAKRALLAICDAFIPLKQSPMIGRAMEDHTDLRELVIDFGTTGYLALYCYEPSLDIVTILAIKHQREDDYK
jgi:plasmid stabilization system protein ParE